MNTSLPLRGRPAPSVALTGGFPSPTEAAGGGAPKENATGGADRLVVGVDFGTTYSGYAFSSFCCYLAASSQGPMVAGSQPYTHRPLMTWTLSKRTRRYSYVSRTALNNEDIAGRAGMASRPIRSPPR